MLDRFISGITFILEVRRQPGLEQEAGRRRRRRGGGGGVFTGSPGQKFISRRRKVISDAQMYLYKAERNSSVPGPTTVLMP